MSKILNRRSFLSVVVGAGAVGGALSIVSSSVARAQADVRGSGDIIPQGSRSPQNRTQPYTACSDTDSTDSSNYGRRCAAPTGGVSDNDPNDPRGHGRGAGGTGATDADPNDPRGAGRGGGARAYTGRNDQDPSDPQGYGR